MMSDFLVQVNLEVSRDQGEDASLVDDHDPDTKTIAVFDGLGGRSAGFDGQTGGQIASQLAKKVTQRILQGSNSNLNRELTHQIQTQICQQLQQQADSKMPQSRLKGTLVGTRLCTTLALASFPKTKQDVYDIEIAWIGDSRIYFLSPKKGLQQLTRDDLTINKDAFEMIREDPPMSQYLTADFPAPDWQINFTCKTLEEPGCLLACTDGCFQYLRTPWDFEKLLLETLADSNTPQQWENTLTQHYENNKQDDVSLLLSPLGVETFEELQNIYQDRLHHLIQSYPSKVSSEELQALWESYRTDYEAELIDLDTSHSNHQNLESSFEKSKVNSASVFNTQENQTPDTDFSIQKTENDVQQKPELPPIPNQNHSINNSNY